jgi:hypothetical protein
MEDSTMLARKKTLLLLSAVAANCAWLLARADATSFELGYYTNWPGGEELAAHDYVAAIAAASKVSVNVETTTALAGATNLCVGYTMTRAFKEAAKSCDDAVALARSFDSPTVRSALATDATSRALSNRGVMRALRGDAAGAAVDLQAAARAAGGAQAAPTRNLGRLESSSGYRDRVALAQ